MIKKIFTFLKKSFCKHVYYPTFTSYADYAKMTRAERNSDKHRITKCAKCGKIK